MHRTGANKLEQTTQRVRQASSNTREDDDRNTVAQPRSVICSPSHIRNIVPVTSVETVTNRNMNRDPAPALLRLKRNRDTQPLEQGRASVP